MSEDQKTAEQGDNQQPLLPIKVEPIVALTREYVPRMMTSRDKAVAAMEAMIQKLAPEVEAYRTDPDKDEAMELLMNEGTKLLNRVKGTYDGVNKLRTEISGPLDELKAYLMQFEKDLAYDAKSKSKYNDIKGFLQEIKQIKLDRVRAAEREAQRKKEIADYKVEMGTVMRKNLLNFMQMKVGNADSAVQGYFDDTTLENFDERAKVFKTMKWKMKQEDFDNCFKVGFDKTKLNQEEFDALVASTKKQETYEIWNEKIVSAITPILNEWHSKIPDIKKQKIELSQAKEDEQEKMREAQRKQSDAEAARRKAEVDRTIQQESQLIDQQAEVDRMGNSFSQQASVQTLDETGPTKKVVEFESDEVMGTAFMKIVYHCMMNKKFPGLKKKGGDEFIDAVAWWIRYFETNCKDAVVPGVRWTDKAKIIVRK